MIRAGDIRQATWYGKELDPTADLDLTLFISKGGMIIQVETTANGNGVPHSTGKRMMAGFDGGKFSCGWDRKDVEFFQDKQNLGVPGPFILRLINGYTYRGDLLPEGQIQVSTGGGAFDIAGRGQRFEQV